MPRLFLSRCLQVIGKQQRSCKLLQTRLPAWLGLGLGQSVKVLHQGWQIRMPLQGQVPSQCHKRRVLHDLRHVQLAHLVKQPLKYIR